jgi:hypothetical protein
VNNAKLASRLTRVLRHAFGQPTLDYQARVMMRDIPGFDSVHFVQMILAMEAEFGFELHEDEVDSIYTMGDVFALLQCKVPKTD